MTESVVITRRGADVGKNTDRRVYITDCRHLGGNIFSSTEDPAKATRFTRKEAQALLYEGKWRHSEPRIEDVP